MREDYGYIEGAKHQPTMAALAPSGRSGATRVDAELAHLSKAIAYGGDLTTLLAAVREREQRRASLQTELATLTEIPVIAMDRRSN